MVKYQKIIFWDINSKEDALKIVESLRESKIFGFDDLTVLDKKEK